MSNWEWHGSNNYHCAGGSLLDYFLPLFPELLCCIHSSASSGSGLLLAKSGRSLGKECGFFQGGLSISFPPFPSFTDWKASDVQWLEATYPSSDRGKTHMSYHSLYGIKSACARSSAGNPDRAADRSRVSGFGCSLRCCCLLALILQPFAIKLASSWGLHSGRVPGTPSHISSALCQTFLMFGWFPVCLIPSLWSSGNRCINLKVDFFFPSQFPNMWVSDAVVTLRLVTPQGRSAVCCSQNNQGIKSQPVSNFPFSFSALSPL